MKNAKTKNNIYDTAMDYKTEVDFTNKELKDAISAKEDADDASNCGLKEIINNIKHGRSAEPSQTVCNGCPCTYTEESEKISNYGCLPDWNQLVTFYLKNKGIWKCHSKDRVCGGLIEVLKKNQIPLNKNNSLLITEDNPIIGEKDEN